VLVDDDGVEYTMIRASRYRSFLEWLDLDLEIELDENPRAAAEAAEIGWWPHINHHQSQTITTAIRNLVFDMASATREPQPYLCTPSYRDMVAVYRYVMREEIIPWWRLWHRYGATEAVILDGDEAEEWMEHHGP
jgi:hypothetical protein